MPRSAQLLLLAASTVVLLLAAALGFGWFGTHATTTDVLGTGFLGVALYAAAAL